MFTRILYNGGIQNSRRESKECRRIFDSQLLEFFKILEKG